jgi:DNA-directed RNA polymerase specialized sigma24 family protein
VMSRFSDMKYREIADKLNISPKTVERQMSIALEKLRQLLIIKY